MLSPPKYKELGYDYKFFGLVFRSNLSLPGIPLEREPVERCDLTLHLGVSPNSDEENKTAYQELTYVSPYENDQGQPVLQIWKVECGAYVRITYDDGTQFWLDQHLQNVWATWPDDLPIENVTCYLLGPVLGLLLRLRGVVCLHASAVAVAGRGVAFMGSAGTGKSTTPESVKMLYGTPEALPRLSPRWDKRRLTLGEQGTSFGRGLLGLAAIYVLGDRQVGAAPLVESMRPQAALLALVSDTYANRILDRELRAREFEVLGRLVSTVPIRRVRASEDAGGLEKLCRVIHEDLTTLGLTSVAPR